MLDLIEARLGWFLFWSSTGFFGNSILVTNKFSGVVWAELGSEEDAAFRGNRSDCNAVLQQQGEGKFTKLHS